MSSGILKCPRITEPEASRHQTGADPGFFLGGGALVSCSTSTPINHIRKPQVIPGGAHPLHPPHRSAAAKAARTTKSSQTLVDHVITNLPRPVTHTDVLPCTLVSDHDASYVFFNQY